MLLVHPFSRKFCKPKTPLMLRLVLGDKVNVVTLRADQSAAMKEEYYRYEVQACAVYERSICSTVLVAWVFVFALRAEQSAAMMDE